MMMFFFDDDDVQISFAFSKKRMHSFENERLIGTRLQLNNIISLYEYFLSKMLSPAVAKESMQYFVGVGWGLLKR